MGKYMFAAKVKNKELISKDANCSHSSRLKKKKKKINAIEKLAKTQMNIPLKKAPRCP